MPAADPQPSADPLPLRRADCTRCVGTIRRPPADEADRCDICGARGVVTFHPLGDNLTRVLLVLEYFPKGLFEKTGNIWRAQGRRARLDLKLFRTFVMMRGEATGGWRGEIRDGEVVKDHETALREEKESREEPEGPEEPEPVPVT